MASYFGYKYIGTRTFSVETCDLTPGDYVLGGLSVIEGKDPMASHGVPDGPAPGGNAVELDEQRFGVAPQPNEQMNGRGLGMDLADIELTPEQREEYQIQMARREERKWIEDVLKERPKRMEKSLLRELWSCIIVDKK